MIKIYRMKELVTTVGISRSQIYASMKAGTFPAGIKIGQRSRGWSEEQIKNWLNSRPQA